jgi:hypothetical protein
MPVIDAADYELVVRFANRPGGTDVAGAAIDLLQSGDSSRVIQLTPDRRGDESLAEFVKRVATLASSRAREFVALQDVGTNGVYRQLSKDSAVAIARRALCVAMEASCRADAVAAEAVLSALPAGSKGDVDVVVLRARADVLQGNQTEALALYQQAAEQLVRRHDPGADSAQRLIAVAVGDIFRAAGNGDEAAKSYQVAWDSRPEIARRLVESLRQADRNAEAINAAGSALRRFPNDSGLSALGLEAVREINPRVLSRNLASVTQGCAGSTTLQQACARKFAGAAASLYTYDSLPGVRGLAQQALTFGIRDLGLLAQAATALAASYMEPVRFVSRNGVQSISAPAFVADSFRKYMALAEQQPPDSVSALTRSWLYRLRGFELAVGGNVLGALQKVFDADSVLHTPETGLAAGELAVSAASQLRGRMKEEDTTSRLARADSVRAVASLGRAVVDRSIRLFPREGNLLRVRGYLCAEYIIDFACAFEANRAMINLGVLRTPREILGAVEAAAIADSLSAAKVWLARIPLNVLNGPCDVAPISIYGYWVTASTAPEAAAQWFNRFAAAIGQLPRNRTNCWYFSGALDRLQRAPPVSEGEKLRGMIASLQDTRIALPAPPIGQKQSQF